MHTSPYALRLALCALGAASVLGFGCLKLHAQEAVALVSSWQCLPEETGVAFRIPSGEIFAETFVKNTKLGAVLLSDARKAAIAGALEKSSSSEWKDFHKQLAEYELTTDDLWQLLAGESGYAIVVAKDSDGKPLPLGLGWLEPGEKLAARTLEIVGQAIENNSDEENRIVRTDITLAGHPVIQLMLPSRTIEYGDDFDLPEDYDEMSDEEQMEAWKQANNQREEDTTVVESYSILQISFLGPKIFVAHAFESSESADEHPNAELLSETFGRFLAEHEQGQGGFVASLSNDPGVAKSLAMEGVVAFELLGDVSALFKLTQTNDAEDETAIKIIRMLGLKGLGPFSMRSTLQGTQWNARYSLAVPQPRQGLMQFLNQQPLATAEPPDWVPASVVEFSQSGFDLGKVYALFKEQIVREFPEQTEQGLAMVEAQVVAFAQASLEEVFSSLGNRHLMIAFEPELGVEGDDAQQPERKAVVWQIEDEEIWSRLFKSLAPLVSSMPGAEFTNEQGYRGFRMKQGPFEGGLFLGNGNLVLAYGRQVLERTLSSLNHPPTGSDAFLGSEVYRQATELLQPESCLSYRVVDGNRYAVLLRDWFAKILEQQEASEDEGILDVDGSKKMWLKLAEQLLPTDDEIQNILGVSVDRVQIDEHGLTGISVQELPPPEDQ